MTYSNDEIDAALDAAAKQTDEELAPKIATLTRLSEAEVKRLFPEKDDVAKLTKLMQIVKGADDRNSRIAALAQNIEGLGGTVLTLLQHLA